MKTKNTKIWAIALISLLITTIAVACKGDGGTFTGSDKQPLNITIAQNEMIKFEKTSRSARTIVAAPFSVNILFDSFLSALSIVLSFLS